MKHPSELNLSPGDLLFVDSVHDGIARLVIGEGGERVETVSADTLIEEARVPGVYLRVNPDGSWARDIERDCAAEEEIDALMNEIFEGPPPSN